MKDSKLMSVITIPLKVEIWQANVINKRMELCRLVYNSMLRKKLNVMYQLEANSEYNIAIRRIRQVYQITDSKLKMIEMKSESFKKARTVSSSMLREAGISEYAFIADVTKEVKKYPENLSSNLAIYSIAKPLWSAFDSYLYANGDEIHEKRYGDINSLATDGKSGIRITNENGNTLRSKITGEKVFVVCGTRGQKILNLPIIIDDKDDYLNKMLDRNVKIVRVQRKRIRGDYRYSVQLSVEGPPIVKTDSEGHTLHIIKDEAIGIYIDTRYLVIANNEGFHTIELNFDTDYSLEIKKLQMQMQRSRMMSNPDIFIDQGKVKREKSEQDIGKQPSWKYSNRYIKAKNKLHDIRRKETERRKIRAYMIANEVLSYGSHIVINDYSFKGAEMRHYNAKSGKYTRKAGTVIAANAPSQILTIIDKKLVASGYNKMNRKHIAVDYTIPDYREYYAKQLLESAF